MSSIGWIDFDEAERQRAQRLMQFFSEQNARDELGLGVIRDSIADHLFPGTSTIQTRLRYMLFIPWIFGQLPSRRGSREIAERARNDQVRLCNALVAGGETIGVIGREAGARLKRLPASVYWSGLGSWGIRQFPGSIEAYAESLPHQPRAAARDHDEDDHGSSPGAKLLWHPRLPKAPHDFLAVAAFGLNDEESSFIVDRLVDSHPGSLLTFLASRGDRADSDSVWTHPHFAEFPAETKRLVAHAESFSDVMYGAALLYNLLVSRLRRNDEWIEYYQGQLTDWRKSLDFARLKGWSLDGFWQEVRHPNHQLLKPTRQFVTDWVDLVRSTRGLRSSSAAAVGLVTQRERRLKRGQSRFDNKSARDRWQGSSGAYRLDFRWPRAKRHLQDLARG